MLKKYIDYCKLNRVTVNKSFSMIRTDDAFDQFIWDQYLVETFPVKIPPSRL